MKENDIKDHWFDLCSGFTHNKNIIDSIFNKIVNAYNEPHRAYHTIDHIADLVAFITSTSFEIQNKRMLLLAAFFHDIVYVPGSKTNEKESAAIAVNAMHDLLVRQEILLDTEKLILLTCSHDSTGTSVTSDMLLFLDMDLSILGAEPEKYKTYAQSVRREFKRFPDFIYNNGRRAFLKSQLNLPVIFKTPAFISQYEHQARVNILNELNGTL